MGAAATSDLTHYYKEFAAGSAPTAPREHLWGRWKRLQRWRRGPMSLILGPRSNRRWRGSRQKAVHKPVGERYEAPKADPAGPPSVAAPEAVSPIIRTSLVPPKTFRKAACGHSGPNR